MKAELFKTDRNVKILIVSNGGDYKSVFFCNSKLFKSDIEFVADFECETEVKVKDLLELLKPDVLLSETGIKLSSKAIKPTGRMCEVIDIQIANNNGTLLLWYKDIDKDDKAKLKTYCTLSLLINHSYEIKNKLGVE